METSRTDTLGVGRQKESLGVFRLDAARVPTKSMGRHRWMQRNVI